MDLHLTQTYIIMCRSMAATHWLLEIRDVIFRNAGIAPRQRATLNIEIKKDDNEPTQTTGITLFNYELSLPGPRTDIYSNKYISFSGAFLWNNLPLTVRSCHSLSFFK